jgi:hypothetical protein
MERKRNRYILFLLLVGVCIFLTYIITVYIRHAGNHGLTVSQNPSEVPESNNQLQNGSASSADTPESSVPKETLEDMKIVNEELVLDKSSLRPADLMDMTWDSWQFDVDFSDREKLAESIESIPIKGKIATTQEQLSKLRSVLCEVLFDFGNNDFDAYYKFLKNSGETFPPYMIQRFRQDLTIGLGFPEDKIASDPWELLSQSAKEYKDQSLWQGLVTHKSQINLFEARTHELTEPGEDLHKIRRAITTYTHVTEPPITLEQIIEARGKAIIADTTLFVTHTDEVGGKVRPYVIRMWYDPKNNLWRPLRMTFFPNAYESLQPKMAF